jgi:hypothetical protein
MAEYCLRIDAGMANLGNDKLGYVLEEIKFATGAAYDYLHNPQDKEPNPELVGTIFGFLSTWKMKVPRPDIEINEFKLTKIYDRDKNEFKVIQLSIDYTEDDSFSDIYNKFLNSLKEVLIWVTGRKKYQD